MPPTLERLGEVFDRARAFGAIGRGADEELIAHSVGFVSVVGPTDGPILDLGSGGGVPGLVIALMTDTRVVLLEAQQRRADHLRWAVSVLDLTDRVEVVQERAEVAGRDASRRGEFAVVTARSFGAPSVVAECAVPFLTTGGRLVISDSPDGVDTRWSGIEDALPLVGPRYHDLKVGGFVEFELSGPIPESLPRRPGAASRGHLF